MENIQYIKDALPWLIPLIMVLAIWDAVWKMIALWKSARNNHMAWFICIGIINSIGTLPIVYILMQSKKSTK